MSTRGYRFVDHTADVAAEVWAESEEDLLVEAARALVEILTEGATVEPTTSRALTVTCLDAEDRLVRWLNEVLWIALSEGFLVAEARIQLADGGLEATVLGEADAHEKLRTEVKSATYHGLRVAEEVPGRYVGRVVFDV